MFTFINIKRYVPRQKTHLLFAFIAICHRKATSGDMLMPFLGLLHYIGHNKGCRAENYN